MQRREREKAGETSTKLMLNCLTFNNTRVNVLQRKHVMILQQVKLISTNLNTSIPKHLNRLHPTLTSPVLQIGCKDEHEIGRLIILFLTLVSLFFRMMADFSFESSPINLRYQ